MKQIILWLAACALTHTVGSQTLYPVANIPPDLLPHANAVVRDHHLQVQVLNAGEAVITEKVVITLLNESAKSFGEVSVYYSDMEKIEDIAASVYDGAGKLIRQLKKKDISDVKPPEVFVEDYRIKQLHLPAASYPYTIEYRTVTRSKNLMFYPMFRPQPVPAVAVESAKFSIVMPAGMAYRLKTQNIPESAKTGQDSWTLSHIPAFVPEPYSPEDQWPFPVIYTAPVQFEIDGQKGNMDSWQSFGQFIYQLNSGRGELPPATVEKARQLTADCPDARCKTERLYRYLQDNSRYFLVAFGIGGWQPEAAAGVDQHKYGDCKGLSNYLHALLKAVEVPSYYTLVHATRDGQHVIQPDFPSPWFNHAFLCVPLGSDTLWLECTNQMGVCGFNSDFTDDRSVLLITPEGGKLVHTPVYGEEQNRTARRVKVVLSPDGSAQWDGLTDYHALQHITPYYRSLESKEAQLQKVYEFFPGGNFEVKSLVYSTKATPIPVTTEQLSLHLPKYASVSGKRLFVPMLLTPLPIHIPATDSARVRYMPVQAHDRGYTLDLDQSVQLPEGYHLESAFAPVGISSPFGRYSLQLEANADASLHLQRRFVLNSKVFPPSQYPELIQFLRQVYRLERQKLVLVKGT